MTKITPDLAMDVIEYTFDRLPQQDKLRIVDRLQHKTRKQRWQKLVSSIRQRAAKSPISDEEITTICEEVRQKRHAQRTKSRH